MLINVEAICVVLAGEVAAVMMRVAVAVLLACLGTTLTHGFMGFVGFNGFPESAHVEVVSHSLRHAGLDKVVLPNDDRWYEFPAYENPCFRTAQVSWDGQIFTYDALADLYDPGLPSADDSGIYIVSWYLNQLTHNIMYHTSSLGPMTHFCKLDGFQLDGHQGIKTHSDKFPPCSDFATSIDEKPFYVHVVNNAHADVHMLVYEDGHPLAITSGNVASGKRRIRRVLRSTSRSNNACTTVVFTIGNTPNSFPVDVESDRANPPHVIYGAKLEIMPGEGGDVPFILLSFLQEDLLVERLAYGEKYRINIPNADKH